jgi:Zn-dependent protease
MNFISLLFYFLIIVPSAIMHEYAHGWMADRLGDSTARYAGRLTLNPRAHIDLWGTVLMPLFLFFATNGSFLFAYAKPVPYNPYNLKDQKWGPVWVALAGPASNFILAALFGLAFQFLPYSSISQFLLIIVYANVMLGVFNLVPVPPLDGSKLLYAVLPDSMNNFKMNLERYSWFILMGFILFGYNLIAPVIRYVAGLFTGGVVF